MTATTKPNTKKPVLFDTDKLFPHPKNAKKHPKDHFADDAIRDAAWLELRHDLPGGEAHMKALMERAERLHLKQTAADDLLKAIREVERGRRVLSPTIASRFQVTSSEPVLSSCQTARVSPMWHGGA